MKNAVILHGTKFSPDDPTTDANWFPWLKKELENKGYKVWLPELPNPELPEPDRYTNFLLSNWEFYEDSVVFGHSSGAVAGFWLLEKLPEGDKIKQLVAVAPFYTNLGEVPELTEIGKHKFNWEKIKKSADEITVIYSDNDPYIPVPESKEIVDFLDAEEIFIPGQKHFSVGSFGEEYRRFPKLLKLIK